MGTVPWWAWSSELSLAMVSNGLKWLDFNFERLPPSFCFCQFSKILDLIYSYVGEFRARDSSLQFDPRGTVGHWKPGRQILELGVLARRV